MTHCRPIVEDLFKQIRAQKGETLTNPVTGERWLYGYDRPKKHKERAMRGLVARAHFKWDVQRYAPDAPPLPLGPDEISELKSQTGLPYLVAVYAQSLRTKDWETEGHPNFIVYARCVMASRFAPDYIKNDPVLQQRFSPVPKDLLGPGLVWPR